MIEQEMFFALGFVTAGLVALACLPAVWRRAIRLTTRRLSRLVPLSGEEIAAERDQLRAVMAVEQRRLEQKLESSESVRASLLADVGRRDRELAARDRDAVFERDRYVTLNAERDALERELRRVMAGVGASEIALYDSTGLAERRRWEVLEAEARARELEDVVNRGRASIAALETRIMGLESRLGDLNVALGSSRAELARTVEAVGRAMTDRDAARRASDDRAAELEVLRQDRDRLAAHTSASVTASRDAATRGAAEAVAGPTEADLAVLRDAIRKVSEDVLRMTSGSAAPRPGTIEPVATARPN